MAVTTELFLINSTFADWENDPVGTTLITLPISQAKFPVVTVCPPEGSNTVLNHAFQVVENTAFTKKERKELEAEVEKIFVHKSQKNIAELKYAILNKKYLDKYLYKKIETGTDFALKIHEMEGLIESPFLDQTVDLSIFKQNHKLHYVVKFPNGFKEQVGDRKLFFDIESKSSDDARVTESLQWKGTRYKVHKEAHSWADARKVCQENGGDLASFQDMSEYEAHYLSLQKIFNKESKVWFGGNDLSNEGQWEWSDGSLWDDDNVMWYGGGKCSTGKTYDRVDVAHLRPEPYKFNQEKNCLSVGLAPNHAADVGCPYDMWGEDVCTEKYPFLCTIPPSTVPSNKNLSLTYKADDLLFDSFHLWWSHEVGTWSMLDNSQQRMTGFSVKWGIEVEESAKDEDTSDDKEDASKNFKEYKMISRDIVKYRCLLLF